MIELPTGWRSFKRVWVFAGVAVALALVILAASALSSPRKAPAPRVKESALATAERTAKDAEKAASLDQTATALSLALRALELDPKNPTALRVKDEVSAGSGEASSAAGQWTGGGAVADLYVTGVKEVATLLPYKFKDWNRGELVTAKGMALVSFEPPAASPSSDSVVRAVFYARDAGTVTKAAATVPRVYKRAYASDGSTVRLGSADSAYFGTDGRQLSAVGFVRGRYSFEVVLTAVPGVDPGDLRQLALEAASSMPAVK